VRPWLDELRALGGAFLGVLEAEVEALREDVSLSARRLAVALALFGAAAAVAFWLVAALCFALVVALALWLPLWATALVLVGLLLIGTALLGWLAMRRLRQFEGPASTVKRRLDDHLGWWRESLLREERPVVETARRPARRVDDAAAGGKD
jgi:hypothetical protein